MSNNSYTDEELLDALSTCESRYGKVTTKLVDNEDDLPHSTTIGNRFVSFSRAKLEADIENTGQIHLTDSERTRINESITDYQKDIMEGLLMGDAWINRPEGKNPHLSIEMVNNQFLSWVENILDDVVSSFRMRATAEELVEKNKSYGYTVNEENYNDVWVLETNRLEYFDELGEWYSSGEKRYPDDLELNPVKLKIWYCCDGSLVRGGYPVIYSSDQSDVRESVLSLFDDIDVNPTFTDGGGGTIRFNRGDVDDFFNYVGDHPPGFAYKWPEKYK